MSLYRLVIAFAFGVASLYAFSHRSRLEAALFTERMKPGRKTGFVEPLLLPIAVLLYLLLFAWLGNVRLLGVFVVDSILLLFVYISLYYSVLLLLLRLIRRVISARACAVLWTLPVLLYLVSFNSTYMADPIFVITLPHQWLAALVRIWAVGFAGLTVWQTAAHIRYRRFLLKNAQKFTDADALSRWYSESTRHGVKAEIPVLVSDAVSTPVTIGCFDRTMRLILPGQHYTDEEYDLIFRHELRHIMRTDTRVKLYWGFCVAVCWFNPLVWVARRKAADDLELSCDEAVLSLAQQSTRKQYAELLLKSAGSGRGYTTCLSASASALRYRLRHVITPAKRLSGGVVVGIAMYALALMVGTVALADSGGSVRALVLEKAPAELAIDAVAVSRWSDEHEYRRVYGWQEAALTEYLASLTVKQVYADRYTWDNIRRLRIEYAERIDGQTVSVTVLALYDGFLVADFPYDNDGGITFILEDDVDWGYIGLLLDFDAPNPDPHPLPPEMMMQFDVPVSSNLELMHAMRRILSIRQAGDRQEISDTEEDESIGGLHGFPATQVKLSFSYAPTGGYAVKVENWDRTASYTVSSRELTEDVLPLAPYSAHYTVYGTFVTVRDTTYEMLFFFDVVLPET